MKRGLGVLGACCALTAWSASSAAQIDPRASIRALGAPATERLAAQRLTQEPARRFPVVLRHAERWSGAPGVVQIAPGFSAAWLDAASLESTAQAHPKWRFDWAPPRRALLDRAGVWTRANAFRAQTGGAGAGAVVGVLDTGIDIAHPDFRRLDGTTRIAWLLDFSKSPAGAHPELEARYGCTGATPCAVFSAADLDAAIQRGSKLSADGFGHGTHVASLAAGNGLSTDPSRYIGVAPEAQLIVVRGDRGASGSFFDADILVGAAFVFERAQELGLPAVLNLSLGSDFGAHDGSSALEQGLAELIGDDKPGRAMVVAAGNSGTIYVGLDTGYPDPLGGHTEVHVPRASLSRVPIITPHGTKNTTAGRVYVWITSRPGDQLEVGLDDADGEWVPPLAFGKAASYERGDLTATVFNGNTGPESPLSEPNTAVVVLDGEWPAGETFALRLGGYGSASIWLQSEGDLAPSTGSVGALVPRAIKPGTINLPGSHPDLIAVGAGLNRLSWASRSGETVSVSSFGSVTDPPLDGMAYFSSAGPNADGVLKPEISAPGAFLVGAMSAAADPGGQSSGIFSGAGMCDSGSECLVVDDYHAVTSGTSMAAPQVAGAVALLFERDPSLTQAGVRALLQAGARRPTGLVPIEQQVGAGALDVMGALEAQLLAGGAAPAAEPPSGAHSWLSLAADFVHPDPDWPIEIYADLRTSSGQIADAFAASALELSVGRGVVRQPLTRVAPGLWRAKVAGAAGSGGLNMRLSLSFNGAPLLSRDLPIAVDPHLAGVTPQARGGCEMAPNQRQSPGSQQQTEWLAALLAAAALARRRPKPS